MRFTRAEIQALRDRAWNVYTGPVFASTEDRLFLQLVEILDLLDAVMCRNEKKA